MAKPAPHGHLLNRKKNKKKKMKAILFMSASNCYNGFRRMYDYQILFQSPSYSLFVTWNIFAVVVENSILLLSSFQF